MCLCWERTFLFSIERWVIFLCIYTNRFQFRFSIFGGHFNCKGTFLCCFNQQKMRVVFLFFSSLASDSWIKKNFTLRTTQQITLWIWFSLVDLRNSWGDFLESKEWKNVLLHKQFLLIILMETQKKLLSFPININLLKAQRTFICWALSSGLRFGFTYNLALEETSDD